MEKPDLMKLGYRSVRLAHRLRNEGWEIYKVGMLDPSLQDVAQQGWKAARDYIQALTKLAAMASEAGLRS